MKSTALRSLGLWLGGDRVDLLTSAAAAAVVLVGLCHGWIR